LATILMEGKKEGRKAKKAGEKEREREGKAG
jgi:hypothetical protein